MNRKEHISKIASYFAQLNAQVVLLNSLNLQDVNVHSENFFRDFLNCVFGYDLININAVVPNSSAIDLGDKRERIAIQVTSTSDIAKIRKTYQGFVKRGLDQEYERLIVLIVGEKKSYREQSIGDDGAFKISLTNDVWDLSDLLGKINNLALTDIKRCLEFLRAELAFAEHNESMEVKTLIHLIEVLSIEEDGLLIGDNKEDPDPKGKIEVRFSDHAEFLKDLFVEYHALYGRALAEVQKHDALSHSRILKLQLHLMNWSDQTLRECDGDPQRALDALTNEVITKLKVSGVEFDEGAIRFYLIYQLIACNVFPNKRGSHA